MRRKSFLLFSAIIFISFGLSACLPFSLLKDDRQAKKTDKKNSSKSKTEKRKKTASNNSEPITLDVGRDDHYVNVMGNEMPEMPDFDELSPEAGKVRGYVKDASGNPLKGAHIGVRSTYFGGSYSGGQGETDEDGFYEIRVPEGVAHFYNAGYEIEWGEGIAALGLHPADGKLDSFASPDGAVENFVLLPYGITSKQNLSESSRLASTYYGGTIYVGYWYQEINDNSPMAGSIVENSVMEITLTPDGEMLDSVEPRKIVVRKTVGFQSGFYIHNIPLGLYKIKATTEDGTPLNLEQNRQSNPLYGMKPAKLTGDEEATILFTPSSAKASMVTPQYGAWDSISMTVRMP